MSLFKSSKPMRAISMAIIALSFLTHQAKAAPDHLPPLTYPYEDQQEYWINSAPLDDGDLRGKAVLAMFWTYSCYNCQNSIEWINHVHEKYRDKGLLVLGIHTPEFEFEHDLVGVQAKTAEFKIEFPVMLDNDYIYWKEMRNSWWPAFYLADANGRIIAEVIGETHIGTQKSKRILELIDGVIDN